MEEAQACEDSDHLSWFVYQSSHSAQSLGYVLVLGWKGSVCVVFWHPCVCQYASDYM